MRFISCLTIFLASLTTPIYSQVIDSTDITAEETLLEILDESFEEEDNSELYNIIEELVTNPIDLNTADIFELQKIPFVDLETAKTIISYRERFGPFYLVQELYSMREIDKTLTDKIIPFVKVDKSTITNQQFQYDEPSDLSKTFFDDFKVILRSRFGNDLQTRKGFETGTYVGSKLRSYNRLIVRYSKNIQAAAIFDKDAGEKDFDDFSSYHLSIKDFEILKNLIIGDYVVEFGQGLMLWSPYSFSKGSDAIFPVKRRGKILKPYTSATEYDFMRGAASTILISDFTLTAFYSSKKIDANIDSVTNKITSTPKTGLHLTQNDLLKKNRVKENILGGRIGYRYKNITNIGVATYYSNFSHEFRPGSIYDIQGNNFNYYSFDYDVNISKFNLFGEFVYNQKSVASLNGIIFSPEKFITLSTSIRNYPRNFINLHGFGFGEQSGKTQNEFGVYFGLKLRSSFGFFNLYYDQFKFPYITFENPVPSSGKEYYINWSYKILPGTLLNLRFKSEVKDVTEKIEELKNVFERIRNSYRFELVYDITKKLRMKSRIEHNTYNIDKPGVNEKGFLIFQDIRYEVNKNLLIQGRIILFDTDSFSSAVYEFENDLAGVLTNLAMYDEGMRWYFLIKYKPFDVLTLSAKYSETYKPNLKTLSSGNNLINNNVDNRISFQIDFNY